MLTRSDFGTLVSGGVLFCLAICGCQRHRYSEHSFDGVQDYGTVAPDGSAIVNQYPTIEPSPDTAFENPPNHAPSFPPAPIPENNPLPPLPSTSSNYGNSHGYRMAQSGSSAFDVANDAGSYQVSPSQPFSYGAEIESFNNGGTRRPRFLKRPKMPPRLFQPIGNKVRHIFRSVRDRLPGRSARPPISEQMPFDIDRNSSTPPANHGAHETSTPPFEPKIATQRLPVTSGGDSPYAGSDQRGPATLEVPEFANLIEDRQSQPTVAPTAQSADPDNYWHGTPRQVPPQSVPSTQLPSPARLQPVPNTQPLPLDRGPSLIAP